MDTDVQKGDIFYADLSPSIGSEQSGTRPVLIVQNNIGNKFSPTVIAAAITSHQKNNLPTHITIKAQECQGLKKDSVVLLEQIRTLDKQRLRSKLGKLDKESISRVNRALSLSLGLTLIP
ncbi:MAG: type II toxin-antitoxin system PemK/MazF family toxin [Firmicutes bacterium]|nr:type II toxin-antitoxin system PemK/MazF family toxin [Bacillota bacterium]